MPYCVCTCGHLHLYIWILVYICTYPHTDIKKQPFLNNCSTSVLGVAYCSVTTRKKIKWWLHYMPLEYRLLCWGYFLHKWDWRHWTVRCGGFMLQNHWRSMHHMFYKILYHVIGASWDTEAEHRSRAGLHSCVMHVSGQPAKTERFNPGFWAALIQKVF